MRPEVARRLTRAVWKQRAKSWLPTVLLVVALSAGAIYQLDYRIAHMDRTVAVTAVNGVVVSARRLPTKAGVTLAHVRLDDGSEVDADSTLPVAPHTYDRVMLERAQHASGRVSYHVAQVRH